MGTWLLLGIIVIVVISKLRRIIRAGNVPFWKLASQNPDAAFEWFINEDCWIVVAPHDNVPGPDYTGPFRLAVPMLGGRVVKVYGRITEIDDSERRFIEQYGESSKSKPLR